MDMKQIWAMSGGFFLVFILITVTNRPHHSAQEEVRPQHRGQRGLAGAGQEAPSQSAALAQVDAPAALAPSFQRGLVLVCPGETGLAQNGSDQALEKIANTGANWIALNVPFVQDQANSEVVLADAAFTPSPGSLAHAVDEAHRRHLRVMLRPLVVAKDGTAREDFAPPSPGKWMVSYTAALLPYLDVARYHQVELVSLGSGYSRIESGAAWGELIGQARRGFSGALTYGAAHAPGAGGGGYQAVPFWATLDYVGIEAFFPVVSGTGQTVAEFKRGWASVATEVRTWARTGSSGKPILFTAVGLPARVGAGIQPGKPDVAAAADSSVQAADCQAFFETVASQSWLSGAFWYAWEVAPSAANAIANPYAVQDQPTLATLQAAYGNAGAVR